MEFANCDGCSCRDANATVNQNPVPTDIYIYATAITSLLSVIGSSFLIISILQHRPRTEARLLLVFLSLSDLLVAVFNIIGVIW